MTGRPAVFVDRDGVLVADEGVRPADAELVPLPGVVEALATLRRAGFAVVVVTNQTVVARGLATELEVDAAHARLDVVLRSRGAFIDRWETCPHHPDATLPAYRVACECRKPRPGMLLRAAEALGLDLDASWMVGDRPSDVAAGARAGCRTVLVTTGRHDDAPIVSADAPFVVAPTHVCAGLAEAVAVIVGAAP